MAYEELFTDLLKAEREEDVTDALTVFGLEKFSDSNWLPYGGIDNNYGIIGAQQADALGALVEKVVNSIDAVLMRECFARNLDPRSNLVPQSMREAAERFLSIPEGNLAKLSTAQRTELAERNISIIVTGQKPDEGNPCVIVVDTGEGQRPEDFKETLVSLLKSNKCSVPFVQGKFNMGTQPTKPPKVTTTALPEIREIKKDKWSEDIEITSDEDVVKIMKDNQTTTSLVNMDNRHYSRYVYNNPKREQEIRNLYKILSTIMGLWLLEQIEKGGLEEEKRRSVSNSLGRLLLPMIDSLGSKLAELEQG